MSNKPKIAVIIGSIRPNRKGGDVGKWVAEHQFFDDAFVARNEFFQQFMLPNGLRRIIGTRAAPVDDDVRERLRALVSAQAALPMPRHIGRGIGLPAVSGSQRRLQTPL